MLRNEDVYPDPLTFRIGSLARTASSTNQLVILRMHAGVSEGGMFREFNDS